MAGKISELSALPTPLEAGDKFEAMRSGTNYAATFTDLGIPINALRDATGSGTVNITGTDVIAINISSDGGGFQLAIATFPVINVFYDTGSFQSRVVINPSKLSIEPFTLGFFGATAVAQGSAIADATDATDVITNLNLLLAYLRSLGLIAT